MYWMTLPLRRYADFAGRSRRLEYWMFSLGYLIAAILIGVIAAMSGAFSYDSNFTPANGLPALWLILLGLMGLALIVPSIAVQVRRFHDQNRTGWLVLLSFIPYVGGLIVLIFMCLPGTPGPNRYGPDPKDPHGSNDVDVFS
ncbi:hypothetical protein ASE70_00625 [Sphingomonas sp. Leaf22]|nr:hypothetical protein ASE70_00625 [Sphingomonas sp. Leaf22]